MVRSSRKAQIKRKLIPKARSGNSERSNSYDKIGRVRGVKGDRRLKGENETSTVSLYINVLMNRIKH